MHVELVAKNEAGHNALVLAASYFDQAVRWYMRQVDETGIKTRSGLHEKTYREARMMFSLNSMVLQMAQDTALWLMAGNRVLTDGEVVPMSLRPDTYTVSTGKSPGVPWQVAVSTLSRPRCRRTVLVPKDAGMPMPVGCRTVKLTWNGRFWVMSWSG